MDFWMSINVSMTMMAIVCIGLASGQQDKNKDTAQRFGCGNDKVYGNCRWIDATDDGYVKWYVAGAPRYGPGYSCRSVDTAYCCSDVKEYRSFLGNGLKTTNIVAQFVNSDQCVAAKTHYP
ncbi:hypothetical protein PTTG_12170 [Puccinia triticina 1-1 BBBD Race 1]|uniref:Hydrophobin n=2 Tax=Puccinia triticina TaxID=208348 RepID=A0A180GLX6_PUCT1|nr:uncharacterized protein PtA15_6A140 [Puccinia triticina]OAV93362.1 hypothetical protein PTTG_12170 [Puccinia triticina 1-1 BBBD Race 1]WAQ85512.1 hypothetical protein PtA15_6A140 [Puccinia triticina]WAR55393.1 hypothetical protein PtB15_6B134 [Puccinia triticina]